MTFTDHLMTFMRAHDILLFIVSVTNVSTVNEFRFQRRRKGSK